MPRPTRQRCHGLAAGQLRQMVAAWLSYMVIGAAYLAPGARAAAPATGDVADASAVVATYATTDTSSSSAPNPQPDQLPGTVTHAESTAASLPAEPAAIRAGKQIYRAGRTRDGGEVHANVDANVDLPGALAACARCHGADGNGGREAGLTAPPLRWATFSQPRRAADGLLARTTGYNQARLLDAIRHGRALAAAMPRFALSRREEADLVDYLRELGSERDLDPGVAPDQVTLAAVLPPSCR